MSSCASRKRPALLALWTAATLAGCAGREAPKENVSAQTSAAAPAPEQPAAAVPLDPRLHQSFAEATVEEPPADWQRPPDLTMTGKSIGKLYTDVVALWDQIKFTAPTGKSLGYSAGLETDLGLIRIRLLPQIAPNHVRSFVALARSGYYDGLVFDRTIHEEIGGKPDARRELIEAGCPLGRGDPGYGSIGYWLKPEFNGDATHDEGTVGASHGEEEDTAACKFYITLCKSPYMDGSYTVFGQVTSGLDIAKKILSLPVRNDPEFPDSDRPLRPVVIRKVIIETEETDSGSPANGSKK